MECPQRINPEVSEKSNRRENCCRLLQNSLFPPPPPIATSISLTPTQFMATATSTTTTTIDSRPQHRPTTSDFPTDSTAVASSTPQPPPLTSSGAEGDSKSSSVNGGSASAKDEPISDVEKKMRRADQFGVSVLLSEAEKRNTRAERFGTAHITQGSDSTKNLEDQKRKARAERFGLGHGQSMSDDAEAKKKARLARFREAPKTNPAEEDKKKARALRFSQPPTGPTSQVNGKGKDVEPKTAIAGKADGAPLMF